MAKTKKQTNGIKLYSFDFEHFIDNNYPIMEKYLANIAREYPNELNNLVFNSALVLDCNDCVRVVDLDNNKYDDFWEECHDPKFLNERYYFATRVKQGKSNMHNWAVRILRKYLKYLEKCYQDQQYATPGQIRDYARSVKYAMFSPQNYADWVIPQIGQISFDGHLLGMAGDYFGQRLLAQYPDYFPMNKPRDFYNFCDFLQSDNLSLTLKQQLGQILHTSINRAFDLDNEIHNNVSLCFLSLGSGYFDLDNEIHNDVSKIDVLYFSTNMQQFGIKNPTLPLQFISNLFTVYINSITAISDKHQFSKLNITFTAFNKVNVDLLVQNLIEMLDTFFFWKWADNPSDNAIPFINMLKANNIRFEIAKQQTYILAIIEQLAEINQIAPVACLTGVISILQYIVNSSKKVKA